MVKKKKEVLENLTEQGTETEGISRSEREWEETKKNKTIWKPKMTTKGNKKITEREVRHKETY